MSANEPLRLLLLTSSTGGGHDMRARSLRQWAQRETDWIVHTHQALESTHALYRFGVGIYNTIQRYQPALHHLYFAYLEVAAMHRNAGRILNARGFADQVRAIAPDVVLSTHAHLNHGFFDLARAALPRPPACVTYCGELSGGYGFSRHWVNPNADAFIAAVDDTRDAALTRGMPGSAAYTGGFALDPRFFASVDATTSRHLARFRDRLRLDADRFTLLLGTGATGANNHQRVLRALLDLPQPPQVIALCGHDAALAAKLDAQAARHRDLPLRTLAYSDEMPLLMRCSNAVFARPGTGTTSEAMLSRCPIIFNQLGSAMPQERITLDFARQHAFGAQARQARDVAAVIATWMSDDAEVQRQRDAMRAATPTGDPTQILEYITRIAAARR